LDRTETASDLLDARADEASIRASMLTVAEVDVHHDLAGRQSGSNHHTKAPMRSPTRTCVSIAEAELCTRSCQEVSLDDVGGEGEQIRAWSKRTLSLGKTTMTVEPPLGGDQLWSSDRCMRSTH
jgi:hypothetical protein